MLCSFGVIIGIWFGKYILLFFKKLFSSYYLRKFQKKKKRKNRENYIIIHGDCINCSIGDNSVVIIEKRSDWHDTIQSEIKKLPLGKYMLNVPEYMKQKEEKAVTIRITQDINSDISSFIENNTSISEEIKVSSLMKVSLLSDNFDIFSLSEEEQIVSAGNYTEWLWRIKPKKFGKLKLYLKITLKIKLPFGIERKDYPIIEREIIVKVSVWYIIKKFIAKYWKWIVTTLIIPLIGWSIKMIIS